MTTKIDNNKYTLTVDGESVTVGKDVNTFSPEITMYRFGDECSLKLYEPTINGQPLSQKNAGSTLEGDVIKWASKDIQFLFYQDGNSFEYELVIANKKAGTNQLLDNISFPISFTNLKFNYQPPLTEEFEAGWSDEFNTDIEVTETDVTNSEGMLVHRPEKVVGSYAVYHSTRTNMHRTKADADKYRCGKAFHIYRPKLIDDVGDTAWADLIITENTLTISFANIVSWLDKAKYPVTIDPNFGYDAGKLGTGTQLLSTLRAMQAVLPVEGTVETITEWVENLSSVTTFGIRLAIYDESGSKPNNLEVESSSILVAPLYDNWKTADVTDTLLSAGTYWLAFQQSSSQTNVFFDSGGLRSTRGFNYNPFPDPYGASTTASFTYSIYATYSVAGGVNYPISLSPGLTASSTVAYAMAWDRSISPGLTVIATVVRNLTFDRAMTQGLTTAVTIAKSFGRKITTSADLTISATIARFMTYTRTMSSGLTASVTILKGWGRSITTTSNLTAAVTIIKGWGRTIVTSSNLTINAIITRQMAYAKAITANITATVSILISRGWAIATNTALTVSATIGRQVAYVRAVSSSLTAAVDVVRVWGRTRVTTTNLTVSVTVSRVLAYVRTTTLGLTISATIVATLSGITNYLITLTTNLTASVTINRVLSYTRATISNLTASASISRFVTYTRSISAGLTAAVTVARTFGFTITTTANLTVSVVIRYCTVLKELIRIPLSRMSAVTISVSRLTVKRLSSSRLNPWRRRRSCSDDD